MVSYMYMKEILFQCWGLNFFVCALPEFFLQAPITLPLTKHSKNLYLKRPEFSCLAKKGPSWSTLDYPLAESLLSHITHGQLDHKYLLAFSSLLIFIYSVSLGVTLKLSLNFSSSCVLHSLTQIRFPYYIKLPVYS